MHIINIEKHKKSFENFYKTNEKELKQFIEKFKIHIEENGKLRDILYRYIKKEKLSKEEKTFIKTQTIDILKSVGVGIPTLLLPLGSLLLGFLVFICNKHDIGILPSYLQKSTSKQIDSKID